MDYKAFEFTEECMKDLKEVIHAPLYYTEVADDGSRSLQLTDFGSNIYDILYLNFKKHTENANS